MQVSARATVNFSRRTLLISVDMLLIAAYAFRTAQNWLIVCHGSELISINNDSLVVISYKIQTRFECV